MIQTSFGVRIEDNCHQACLQFAHARETRNWLLNPPSGLLPLQHTFQ